MGKLEGKVAFITGVARGQGRSHAVALAREGADIVGIDICGPIAAVGYALASEADLDETVGLVEAEGRAMVASVADVRDQASVIGSVEAGMASFGRLDIVVANAGIIPVPAPGVVEEEAWGAALDVMLTGTWHTLRATAPVLVEGGRGGSIVIISSSAGLQGFPDLWGGVLGYAAAKHGVVGLMRSYATVLAPHGIRVNSVHPTGVRTPMVENEVFGRYMAEHPEVAGSFVTRLPVPVLDPADVTGAVLYLVSDEARAVTGITLPVDAGLTAG